jgi:hypothetical protein
MKRDYNKRTPSTVTAPELKELASVRIETVAELFDVDTRTVQRLIADPEAGFPVFRLQPMSGKSHLRVLVSELRQWIRRQQRLTAEHGVAGGIHAAGKQQAE